METDTELSWRKLYFSAVELYDSASARSDEWEHLCHVKQVECDLLREQLVEVRRERDRLYNTYLPVSA